MANWSAWITERGDQKVILLKGPEPEPSPASWSAWITERGDQKVILLKGPEPEPSPASWSAWITERGDQKVILLKGPEPEPSPASWSAWITERGDLAAIKLKGASFEPRLLCAVGVTNLLMAGASIEFRPQDDSLLVAGLFVAASQSGKKMRFRSAATAEAWADLLVVRAASEVGFSSALPPGRREVWKEKKLLSLQEYQWRLVECAAKLPVGSEGELCLLEEVQAVQRKIDNL
ncbi:MAG: hypothetical protein J5X22_09405 [Candidatus Accumulibacter sp.]|uniref:hypothetical protein n=1 Tax=Accumulibacter sp. TaxID=2053492 RepID=UPI001B0E57DB|nr:hypothetical protein [Accumulibacter sp.]MBO3710718.1 hypothetical protein [Accumulibacter sp.]